MAKEKRCTGCYGRGKTRNSWGHEQTCPICRGSGKPARIPDRSMAEIEALEKYLKIKIGSLEGEIGLRRSHARTYKENGETLRALDADMKADSDEVLLRRLRTMQEMWWL